MNAVLAVHIAGGGVAILAGALAITARKGGKVHAIAGTWFFGSMLLLGATASILDRISEQPQSGGLGGLLTCYFVATAWVAARRKDGTTGRFEIAACALALGTGAALIWAGLTAIAAPRTVGTGPIFALAGVCILAGLLDLNAILRRKLTPTQRIARHLWRMCLTFFIATGSFFLGQQDVFPEAVHGSPILVVLAVAPVAVMAFWLVRIRFGKLLARLKMRSVPLTAGAPSDQPSAWG